MTDLPKDALADMSSCQRFSYTGLPGKAPAAHPAPSAHLKFRFDSHKDFVTV